MNILFVVPELTPIIKVGGLGDVAGALPKALVRLGHDVRIVVPDYGSIDHQRYPSRRQWDNLSVRWCGQTVRLRIDVGALPDSSVPVYYLVCPEIFVQPNVGGVYLEKSGGQERVLEMQRFIFFSWAVAQLVPELPWQPTIIHCHDWTAATIPTLLTLRPAVAKKYATVLTIHNLQNQGVWSPSDVWAWLGLRGDEHPWLGLRDHLGNFNALQQGIHAADAVNTVSPQYAKEILTPEYGERLETDLLERPGGVRGILNGLDIEEFDPATDKALARTYTTSSVIEGKRANRLALAQRLHLPAQGPLYGFIGRLTPQKGIDLLLGCVADIVRAGGQLIILGSGLPEIEAHLQQLNGRYPRHIRAVLGFDAGLAQTIYAASDFFLMPSSFEPCGLGQLIAMRYGALPIVRDTGGLHDTVVDLRQHPHRGTGFVFAAYDPAALRGVIEESLRLYHQPDTVQAAILRAMYQDFSWTTSARAYHDLYGQTIRHVSAS